MTMLAPAVVRMAPRLGGSIRVPSDKSIAHRALICAALAAGQSRITLRRPGADVLSTLGALRALGVATETEGTDDQLVITLCGLGTAAEIGRLGGGFANCGNSGTSMRLLMGAVASGAGVVNLIGDESLSRRPMARVADPLRAMGADISLDNGHAPVVVSGQRPLRAMSHALPVASAQVVGAISLAALAADGVTTVRVPGSVRDHTERMLAALGATIAREADGSGSVTTITGPVGLRAQETHVPGDFSSAAAWLVAGAIHPDADVRIIGVGLNPTRTALIDVLRAMGGDVKVENVVDSTGEPLGDVVVSGGHALRSVSLGANDVAPIIDELPLIAVAMASATGTSEVRGAGELRIKESDRISAMAAALSAAGATVEELTDGWRIAAGHPQNADVVTHGDHRIAMSMAVAAITGVASGVVLDDPGCVAVSYPSFWGDAHGIGAAR